VNNLDPSFCEVQEESFRGRSLLLSCFILSSIFDSVFILTTTTTTMMMMMMMMMKVLRDGCQCKGLDQACGMLYNKA
jgi:hypothetical protein